MTGRGPSAAGSYRPNNYLADALASYGSGSAEGFRQMGNDIGSAASWAGKNYVDAASQHSGMAGPIYGVGNALLGLKEPAADLWDAISGSANPAMLNQPHAENLDDKGNRRFLSNSDYGDYSSGYGVQPLETGFSSYPPAMPAPQGQPLSPLAAALRGE